MANTLDFLPGKGSLTRRLTLFALPIVGSGVVQQSFNSVDVAIAGRSIGVTALAAVGVNGAVISLMVTLLMGISLGSNVVIARALGAADEQSVRRAVATQWSLALVCSVIVLALGLSLAEPILLWLETPAQVLPQALLYLKIYALGFPAMLIYNFSSAVLRSKGDTRRPFFWLVGGGLLNILLNLLFVLVLSMGVEGVAIATVAGNVLAAIGVTLNLTRESGALRLYVGRLKVYGRELRQMLAIGLPAGLQGSVFALSNVAIQGAINGFGPEAAAGSAAAVVWEVYAYFVISSMVQAVLTFCSAAYGAGHPELVRRILLRSMMLAVAGSALVNITVACMPKVCCSLFADNPLALDFAEVRVRTVLMVQFIACSYEVTAGALRALGWSLTPMLITICGTCVLRLWWVTELRPSSFRGLMEVYPLTWILTGGAMLLAWHIVSRRVLGSKAQSLTK